MPLTYPTFNELAAQITAEFRVQLPSVDPTVFGSWALSFARGNAVLAQSIMYLVRDLEVQMFPQTATGEFLDQWGDYEGLPRLQPQAGEGWASVTGTATTFIAEGTAFTGGNGIAYETITDSTIQEATQNIMANGLTSSGLTATAEFTENHQLATGMSVVIAGATQTEYNGTYTVTVTSNRKFQYTFAGSVTSPATTASDITVTADVATIRAQAQTGGLDTNLAGGGTLSFDTPLVGADDPAVAQFDGMNGGTSLETDDAYRERILLSRSIQQGVFTPDQIKLAVFGIAGNTRAWVKQPTEDITSEHTITTLSSSGTTATADCALDHGLQTGMEVTISGAVETNYNVTAAITYVDDDTFTYTIVSTTSPATGSPVWVGIGNAVYPEAGQTSVYFLRDDDESGIFPTPDKINETKFNGIIPNGAMPANMVIADLFVQGPTPVSQAFTFSAISPDTPTMRDAIADNLKAFFDDAVEFEEDVTGASYLGAIQNTQDLETGDFISTFTLSTPGSPYANIAVLPGEIAVLGVVSFT